jgi:uncharacterized protein YjdB
MTRARTAPATVTAVLVCSAVVFGCAEPGEITNVKCEVLTTMTPSAAIIEVGATQQFSAAFSCNGEAAPHTFRSSDSTVARVIGDGTVVGVSAGTVIITAVTNRDTLSRTSASLAVITNPACPLPIRITPTAAIIGVGDTQQFTAIFGCADPPPAHIYRTSDPAIAAIIGNGLVQGLRQGTAVITAIQAADTTKRASAVLSVAPPRSCPVIAAIAPANATIRVGETQQYSAVFGCTTAQPGHFYRSSDPNVAALIGDGLVQGLRAGTAVITAIQATDTTKRATAALTVLM